MCSPTAPSIGAVRASDLLVALYSVHYVAMQGWWWTTGGATSRTALLVCIRNNSFFCPLSGAGVSRSMGVGAPLSTAIELGLNGYLAVASRTSVGRGHMASSDAFHGNTLLAPSLWFYSKADHVADWQRIEVVQDKWRSRGISVEQCRWEDSPHIQHGRVDPERYFGALEKFLEKHDVI